MSSVLRGESYRGLPPPRKAETQQRKVQLQLTPTTVNRHHSQIKPRTPPQNLPTSQVAEHPSAQQACTHLKCTCPELHRTVRVIVRVLSVNATQCAAQAVPHYYTDTTRNTWDTRRRLPAIMRNRWSNTDAQPASVGGRSGKGG